jgi:hypothetical protein
MRSIAKGMDVQTIQVGRWHPGCIPNSRDTLQVMACHNEDHQAHYIKQAIVKAKLGYTIFNLKLHMYGYLRWALRIS